MSVKQASRDGYIVGANGVGEKSVVTDAMKAIGQNVQEEAADELVAVERHGAIAVYAVVSVILEFERDAGAVKFEKPAVGDGDAVRVARQIGQDLVWSGERPLGVDHPVRPPQWLEIICECGRISERSVLAEKRELLG